MSTKELMLELKKITFSTWLTPQKLEEEYEFSKNRQAVLRCERKIPYHKVGSYVRYKRSEIDAWLDEAKVV